MRPEKAAVRMGIDRRAPTLRRLVQASRLERGRPFRHQPLRLLPTIRFLFVQRRNGDREFSNRLRVEVRFSSPHPHEIPLSLASEPES